MKVLKGKLSFFRSEIYILLTDFFIPIVIAVVLAAAMWIAYLSYWAYKVGNARKVTNVSRFVCYQFWLQVQSPILIMRVKNRFQTQ